MCNGEGADVTAEGLSPLVLAELHAAGVPVTADDGLAIILTRLQAQIVGVATADPEAFDRGLYDQLMHLWETLSHERYDDANN